MAPLLFQGLDPVLANGQTPATWSGRCSVLEAVRRFRGSQGIGRAAHRLNNRVARDHLSHSTTPFRVTFLMRNSTQWSPAQGPVSTSLPLPIISSQSPTRVMVAPPELLTSITPSSPTWRSNPGGQIGTGPRSPPILRQLPWSSSRPSSPSSLKTLVPGRVSSRGKCKLRPGNPKVLASESVITVTS